MLLHEGMSLTPKQVKWNIHEAVILLEGYLEIMEGGKERKEVTERVSADLRQMAVNRGMVIDDVFRDVSGIAYQLYSIESAYRGVTNFFIHTSRLFITTVELYRYNRARYNTILDEAKKYIAGDALTEGTSKVIPDTVFLEEDYRSYLKDTLRLSKTTCYIYVLSIRQAERFAAANGYEQCSFFGKDRETIITLAKALYSDPNFKKFDDLCYGHLMAAINRLLKFTEEKTAETGPQSALMDEISNAIREVLKEHYAYGLKYESKLELMRFRKIADQKGIILPEDDEELRRAILTVGIVIDGRLYLRDDEMLQELQGIVDDIFSTGSDIIFYESLYEQKQKWMREHTITSFELLKGYLQKSITGCSFAKNFLIKGSRRTEREAITDELRRIWGTEPVESGYNLKERLPFVPLDHIWRAMSGNDLFVWVAEGEYLLTDRLMITDEEKEAILKFADETCRERGYVPLLEVPLGDLEEVNYQVPKQTIYNAIYKMVLMDKYKLYGLILTTENTQLDTIKLLKQFLKDKDECTVDEAIEKAIELTKVTDRYSALQALYDVMVRVSKTRFVADRFVDFDVDEIDAVLSGFITDHFRAVRDVTTFALFPLCGQNWNHYLLESFCYKYSRKYSLHKISFNDKNAGIIAENDFNRQYYDMIALALARADVKLTPELAGKYLVDNGYMARSKFAALDEILQTAAKLREER